MITRNEVISDAITKCLKEIYSYVVPKTTWDRFIDECKAYNNKYKAWKNYNKAFGEKENKPEIWIQYKCTFRNWEDKSVEECIGPKPFEFYYLSKDILDDIVNSYIEAYKLNEHKELLNTIEILKNYCKDPIIDKYIREEEKSGYRGYDHPDNLKKEIKKILGDVTEDNEYYQHTLQDKFFEFLDMTGKFFKWNVDLNTFNTNIYIFGPAPCSNKETVIKNWKEYRSKDIEINEEQIKKEYYGENEFD